MSADKPSILKTAHGTQIAYHQTKGDKPGIIFFGGFRSDMTGVKATALEAFSQKNGNSFVRFDYSGHGQSSGKFEECTLGDWLNDALAVFEKLTKGPQILIGSSMGGWIALLLAIAKPKRTAGIIGLASAPDFTENLIWEKLTDKQKGELKNKGKVMVPSDFGEPYAITQKLITEARKYLLLHATEIPIFCPVRLLHGMSDADVPWEISMALNEKLASKDVKTILIEGGDHRLSEPKDIEKLLRVTEKLYAAVK